MVNLMEIQPKRLAEALDYASVISGKTSKAFKFDGGDRMKILSLVAQNLNVYNRTASGNRYGTPAEQQDTVQYLYLDKDYGYSIPVDKGNYIEGNYLKTSAAVFKNQLNRVVAPKIEKDFFERLCSNSGTVNVDSAPSAATIIGRLGKIEAAFRNNLIPKERRFVAVPTSILQLFRQSLTNCDGITNKLLLNGLVGRYGTLLILEIADTDVPADVYLVAWQQNSVVFEKTIDEVIAHDHPQGFSGSVNEGRFRWGGGIVGEYAGGVYVDCKSTARQADPSISNAGAITVGTSSDYTMYTVDGSDPRYSSTAVKITSGTTPSHTAGDTIKAVSYKAGLVGSAVITKVTTS